MNQQTIKTSLAPEVNIGTIQGNLQVKGWERPEVVVKAASQDLDIQEQDDVAHIRCESNCTIRLPHGATVRTERVEGEARFKLLEDPLQVGLVQGTLILRDIAEVRVEQVEGQLMAKNIQGDLLVDVVQGNCSVRNVQGQCIFEKVEGNADLRDIEGSVNIHAGGNLRLRLSVMAGESYDIEAEGNVHCRIPQDASVKFVLTSQAELIRISLPDRTYSAQQSEQELVLGGGDTTFSIRAGGTIFLTAQAGDLPQGDEEEFDMDLEGFSSGFNQQIAEHIESQISAQMEAMSRQLNAQMEAMSHLTESLGRSGLSEAETDALLERARATTERATARAQEKMRRAQEKLERKLEATRRRQEARAQAMERRTQSRSRGSWNFEVSVPGPGASKSTDEERLLILRMLEQKKITVDEAEQLLAALESKE